MRAATTALVAACTAAPALAGEVGRIEQKDLLITIRDTRDWCPAEALSALWEQPQLRVRGCYLERDGVLLIVWEDGDRHLIKREVFERGGGGSKGGGGGGMSI